VVLELVDHGANIEAKGYVSAARPPLLSPILAMITSLPINSNETGMSTILLYVSVTVNVTVTVTVASPVAFLHATSDSGGQRTPRDSTDAVGKGRGHKRT